jgi:hypothetical protein
MSICVGKPLRMIRGCLCKAKEQYHGGIENHTRRCPAIEWRKSFSGKGTKGTKILRQSTDGILCVTKSDGTA